MAWLVFHPGQDALAEPSLQRANALYQNGLAEYQRGDYARAVQSFQAAYDVSHVVGFLFNVGLAYRKLGDCDRALAAFERFAAAEPDAARQHAVEDRIAEMRRCAQPPPTPVATPPAIAPPPTPVVELPAPPPRVRRTRSRLLPLAVAVPGLALLITGAALAGQAGAHFDELEGSCGHLCRPSQWAGYEVREPLGYALLGVGGAALMGSLVWTLVDQRRGRVRVP